MHKGSKNTAIKHFIVTTKDTDYIWLGASDMDVESVYTWLDKTNVLEDGSLTWAPEEPNGKDTDEHCLAFGSFKIQIPFWGFHDADCGRRFFILCEFKII